MNVSTDRIEQHILLHAPVERVWRALIEPDAFGAWFGMVFDGPFVVGQPVTGRIAPTQVDPEVAKLQQPHAGKPFKLFIERIEPMRLFAWRWHPYAVDADTDYDNEPTTLVTFELEAVGNGTMLRLTESGFDRLPHARRADALRNNAAGWTMQMGNIEKYVAAH
ncbi:MAG: SRPBCC family protein [Rhodanobacter sp.]